MSVRASLSEDLLKIPSAAGPGPPRALNGPAECAILRSMEPATNPTETPRPDAFARYAFGAFTLDAATLELTRDGAAVPFEPLPARILLRLVRSAGSMVSREELRRLGWPHLPEVADDSLNTCVRQIREALGDDAADPAYVETLRGRGYRFRAEVRVERPAPAGGRWYRGRGSRARWGSPPRAALAVILLAAGALAAVVLATGGHLVRSGAGSETVPADVRTDLASIRWILHHRGADAALEAADRAVAASPGRADVRGSRAEVLVFLGRTDEAWAEAGRALERDPEEPVALRAVALLHVFGGAWDRAAEALHRSIARAPDLAETWLARAYLRTVRGAFAGAAADLDRALALDPLSPIVHHDAGLLHLWAGRLADARAACGRAAEIAPDRSEATACAFDAALLAGDREDAVFLARRLGFGDADAVRAALEERTRRGSAYERAAALALLGRRSEALDAIEETPDEGGFAAPAAGVDPRLDPLRGEPRFRAVVERLGLGNGVPNSEPNGTALPSGIPNGAGPPSHTTNGSKM